RATSHTLEATYYLYVLYALQAIEGSRLAEIQADRFLQESRGMARLRRNRTKSFEWYGNGSGITRLVHHSELGDWQQDTEFWKNTDSLTRLPGRIARIEGPQAGHIEIPGGMMAFFVP